MTSKRRNGRRICDEVLLNIFSRQPTHDAARCAALSRHHRRVIGSLDFWLLHRRLGPPTPRPRVAYMASSELPGGCSTSSTTWQATAAMSVPAATTAAG